MDTRTVEALNQLIQLHQRSLPMYLADAWPHRERGDDRAADVLTHVIEDQRLMVDRIATLVEAEGGTVENGEFPMDFTNLHDLSMDYILQLVTERQRAEVDEIEQLSGRLAPQSQAKALAQEALGASKAHLQSLEECLASPAS